MNSYSIPRVSVIIPAYNRVDFLRSAIDSVLAQTVSDFQLIVIDDGSSESLVESKSLVESQGHLWLRTDNRGVSAARNLGASYALAPWLAFLDSDDSWLPTKLERQLDFLAHNPQLTVMQCKEIWYRNGVRVNPKKRHQMPNGEAFFQSLELCCISPSGVVLSRELFLELGGFDEKMKVCEDYDLWIRLTSKCPVGLLDEALVVKNGGREDQLSRSSKAIDRFRVYALVKLILNVGLEDFQLEAVKTELQKKAGVLASGAKKRGLDSFRLYSEVMRIAAGQREEQAELAKALDPYFHPLWLQL